MKNLQNLVSPPGAVATLRRNSSSPLSAPGSEVDEQMESSRPELFLAWSNAREIADGPLECDPDLGEEYIAAPSPFPLRSGQRDFGLWLLGGVLTRRESWAHISAESIADPFPPHPIFQFCYAAVKRVGDLCASLLLLVLLMPVLVLVAALVMIDSPGPALFRQRRIGKNGKEFLLWKFRSMHVDVPKYEHSPTTDLDCRLTRVGRLIRRMSIDELPQLVNVLKGEMSLVGPRPEMPFIANRYRPLERKRLAVKPGITGLWQVSPARAFPIHENLQYDLHYIHHQNPILDGAILLRTVVAVIRGVGAV